MALFGREFIAVPDSAKSQIVFKWPDINIRRMSRAIVDADELALFVNKGQVEGTMGPGQHLIDADELPFLGAFIDYATRGNAYRAELYFVGTREYTGQKFGGRIDNVQDPRTGLVVTLRIFGDYSLRPKDPAALVTQLTGTVDTSDNSAVTDWISNQVLKVARTLVTEKILGDGWPILGLAAKTDEFCPLLISAANDEISGYGLELVRMGNVEINLEDNDEEALKRLAKDTAYTSLAGGFSQYSSGEAMLGAGEGMAKGGAATSGAFLAAGLNAMSQQPAIAGTGSEPGASSGRHFCAQCGLPLGAEAKFCPNCGVKLDG